MKTVDSRCPGLDISLSSEYPIILNKCDPTNFSAGLLQAVSGVSVKRAERDMLIERNLLLCIMEEM